VTGFASNVIFEATLDISARDLDHQVFRVPVVEVKRTVEELVEGIALLAGYGREGFLSVPQEELWVFCAAEFVGAVDEVNNDIAGRVDAKLLVRLLENHLVEVLKGVYSH
jgi:hypothetical protein